MSQKFEKLAEEIVDYVGGTENIISVHHCQTRLRFKLKDEEKADKDAIAKLDGVIQVLDKGGMFQVVIGMDVAQAYEEVEKIIGTSPAASSEPEEEKKKKPFDIVADFISSIFSPIVPALAGAGMIKALLAFLTAFNLISKDTQTYAIINMIGDATFAFMPVLLAYTTAKKLKCNPILAAVTAGILCHPTWTGLVAAGDPVNLFGFLPLYLVRYTNSVIPIVLVILVQAPVEKWLNKVIPGSVRLVFAPMIEFLVMGVLGLFILGPAGDYVGRIFTVIFTWLSENIGWLECGLMGGLYSILVIFGLHHGLAPLGTMQMAQMGYDGIFGPGVLCANIGQGTSALVTGLLSKDSKTKQVGISAGITGLMGTTEPALYGLNVPKKYPLVAGAVGAACGGLYAGFTHTHRYATGSSGLPAVVMYIGDGTMTYFYNILIALGITIAVTAVLTFILFKKNEGKKPAAEPVVEEKAESSAASEIISAPVNGKAEALSHAQDAAFASEAMGKGCVIEPEEGVITAPFDGTIEALFPTGHAIGLKSRQGAEVLIHIGIDTVEMNGKGFKPFVKQGDQVTKGQKLIEFDREEIRKAGHPDQVMVIVTNTADYKEVSLIQEAEVKAGENLLSVKA